MKDRLVVTPQKGMAEGRPNFRIVESARTMYCKLRVRECIWLSSQFTHPLHSMKTELRPFDI